MINGEMIRYYLKEIALLQRYIKIFIDEQSDENFAKGHNSKLLTRIIIFL